MKSIFNVFHEERIEDIILAFIESGEKGSLDVKLHRTLLKRRNEVVRFLEQEFSIANYDFAKRQRIYAVLFGLFSRNLDKIRGTLEKLLSVEENPQGKIHLTKLLARRSHPAGETKPQNPNFLAYRDGAEKGRPDAQFLLGLAYEFERGVPKDVMAAREWYSKAAAQGHSKAQAALKRLDK